MRRRQLAAVGTNSCSNLQSLCFHSDGEQANSGGIAAWTIEGAATAPVLTGSSPVLNTIGIVAVAAIAACYLGASPD